MVLPTKQGLTPSTSEFISAVDSFHVLHHVPSLCELLKTLWVVYHYGYSGDKCLFVYRYVCLFMLCALRISLHAPNVSFAFNFQNTYVQIRIITYLKSTNQESPLAPQGLPPVASHCNYKNNYFSSLILYISVPVFTYRYWDNCEHLGAHKRMVCWWKVCIQIGRWEMGRRI